MIIQSRALGCLVRLNTPAKLWQIRVNCTLEINHLSYWTQMSSPFRLWQKWYTLHTSCSVSQTGPNTVSQSVGSHECATKNVNIFFWRGGCDHSERVQWTERGSGSLFLPVQLHKGKKLISLFIKPSYSIEDILLLLQFRLMQTYLFKITKSYSIKFGIGHF